MIYSDVKLTGNYSCGFLISTMFTHLKEITRYIKLINRYCNIKLSCHVKHLSRVESRIPLTGLTLPHVCACPKPGPGFSMSYVCCPSLFMFSELR